MSLQDDTPPVPLPKEGHGSLSYWQDQIQSADEKRLRYKEQEWDKNVQYYLGRTLDALPQQDTVVVPKDFANVERKKAELFFQNPDVTLTPKMPGLEDAVFKFQAVLNQKLGPDGVDAGTMMTETTFDACMTGMLCSKIGYESFSDGTLPVQIGEEETQPGQMLPGAVLGLGPMTPSVMEPQFEQVPNIIYERYFWERVSPAKVLIPSEFSGFNYDKAPWLGFEFEENWEILRRKYELPEDAPGGGAADNQEHMLKSERQDVETRSSKPKRRKGWEIWYRASLYDPAVKHPERLRTFVLLEGWDEPIDHRESPYQKIGPNGKLKGMLGYPIHIGAMRYVSDTAFPTAEPTIGRNQVKELSKSRTQMLLQRDRNVPMRLADVHRLGGQAALDKIQQNVWQAVIPVVGLDANNPPIQEIARANYPPEDFQFNSIISRDLDEVWAFGPNQRGLETAERKTATEIQNIQSNVSTRLDYERRHIIRFYVRGAEKLGALIQLFAGPEDYIEILGQDGSRRLQVWNKEEIQGEFVYDAKPDSAVRVDAAREFRDLLELYNLTAKDPHVNRVEILTKMARLRNLDPSRYLVPKLPERKPPPPGANFAFKGEDLLPTNPHFPIVLEILLQAGYKISPQAIQAAQQHAQAQAMIMNAVAEMGTMPEPGENRTHPGAMGQAERISKHQSERTGERSGPPVEMAGMTR